MQAKKQRQYFAYYGWKVRVARYRSMAPFVVAWYIVLPLKNMLTDVSTCIRNLKSNSELFYEISLHENKYNTLLYHKWTSAWDFSNISPACLIPPHLLHGCYLKEVHLGHFFLLDQVCYLWGLYHWWWFLSYKWVSFLYMYVHHIQCVWTIKSS